MPAPAAMPMDERLVAGRQPSPEDDPSQAALRAHALEVIDSMAANPASAPGDVAAELGISERTLLRAFEHDPVTIGEHLARARLDLALAHLEDVRQRRLEIAVVAGRSGFASVGALERAVLKETGLTPSEYRSRALGPRRSARRVGPAGTGTTPARRALDLLLFLR